MFQFDIPQNTQEPHALQYPWRACGKPKALRYFHYDTKPENLQETSQVTSREGGISCRLMQ